MPRSALFVCASLLALLSGLARAANVVGVEVADTPCGFIDVMKWSSAPTDSSGNAIPVDGNGWPMNDAYIQLFDDRAFPAWAPPVDDPLGIVPNVSGAYTFSFSGKASVGSWAASISNVVFNSATWTTTGTATLPPGSNQFVIIFSSTYRTATSAVNTGITNIQVVQPGYTLAQATTQIFTNQFLLALAPFNHLRFMNWRDTNYNTQSYGTTPNGLLQWSGRRLTTDASQSSSLLRTATQGVAWEYVIALGNALNKDVWINIPVQASGNLTSDTSSYIYQLATLFKNTLNPGLNVYIEHSNEVWNGGFSQFAWNNQTASAEVTAPGSTSPLNLYYQSDAWGSPPTAVWAYRRHGKRVYEIGQIFAAVFGAGSLNTRIRPIYAHFVIAPFQFNNTLYWLAQVYGPPTNYIWGLAGTHYYDEGAAASSATVSQVVSALNASSNSGVTTTSQLRAIATWWGIHQTTYEGGSGFANLGSTTNLANRIMANRDPAMFNVVQHDFVDNYLALGGELYNYFGASGLYSRYGCWGLTDIQSNLTTPKYTGMVQAAFKSTATSTQCVSAPLNNLAKVTCPSGLTISGISYANFGTQMWSSCGSEVQGSCAYSSSKSVLVSKCQGLTTCSVNASVANFGDACPGTTKSLLVRASCSICQNVAASASAVITCPSGQTIRTIGFASYGTFSSTTCGAEKVGSCAAVNSVSVVQGLCLGKAQCSVAATSANFGEPCSGTTKRLLVRADCF